MTAIEKEIWLLCKVMGTTPGNIKNRDSRAPLRDYRKILCCALFVMFKRNYTEIGRAINRDHSSVINAVQTANDIKEHDPWYMDMWGEIMRKVNMEKGMDNGDLLIALTMM